MFKLFFLYTAPSEEGIRYSTRNPTGNITPCCKEPTEYDFMFSYVTFFSSIVLCLKSPVIKTSFIYVWNSCISRCVCRYI